jgi:hypothetical protein
MHADLTLGQRTRLYKRGHDLATIIDTSARFFRFVLASMCVWVSENTTPSILSRWFYDTSTGAITGAVPLWFFCWSGSDHRGVGYQGIQWTRRFTWFGPPGRNTLRPRVKGVVLLCLSARLRSSLFSPSVRACSSVPCDCRLPGPFIAQGPAVTGRPHDPTGGPGASRPLMS